MVAFHEAVPGHHLQLSRLQLLTGLPALQRQRSLTVFSEGWGLYAEQLAEEAGLYADDRALLGSVSSSLMRAARLVVDTGIHAFGWSRERALEYIVEHVPMPREFLADEIDRYVVMPGQALAYLTGKLEILRIREEARRRLGPDSPCPPSTPPSWTTDRSPARPGPQHHGLAGPHWPLDDSASGRRRTDRMPPLHETGNTRCMPETSQAEIQIPVGGEPADVTSICVGYSYWTPKCATGFD